MELHPPIDWSHLTTQSSLDRLATKEDLAPLATRVEVASEIRASTAELREHVERVIREAFTTQSRHFIVAVGMLVLTMVGSNVALIAALT